MTDFPDTRLSLAARGRRGLPRNKICANKCCRNTNFSTIHRTSLWYSNPACLVLRIVQAFRLDPQAAPSWLVRLERKVR